MKRRTLIKTAGIAAAAVAGSAMFPNFLRGVEAAKPSRKPNILVVMVDQLRFPQGAFTQGLLDDAAPNMAALRQQSVSFDSHFAAATACSPSRSTITTGLYTHQNGMFLTNAQGLAGQPPTPDMNPGFPTYGSILGSEGFGYNSYWWGKWHLSSNDQTTCDYTAYGFKGNLPCPSPDGGPGQGLNQDPVITQIFQAWLTGAEKEFRNSRAEARPRPWCTTVSLVNPHDVQWYPKYTPNVDGENNPPAIPEFHSSLPPNFEKWPQALFNENKPRLQFSWTVLSDSVFGPMPTNKESSLFPDNWYELLDLYYQVTTYVDTQIGIVLKALASSIFADNTIVVFTSDHGEYGGAHGMHGKAFALYDEAIHVPLYVMDPTQSYIAPDQRGTTRTGMTSHVDFVPLLMSLAKGGNDWRKDPRFSYLAKRANMVRMLRNPEAPGRDYILHTSDEDIPEEAPKVGIPYTDAIVANVLPPAPLPQVHPPSHAIAYRTKDAKLGVYSYFKDGTIKIQRKGQQSELYDYANYGNLEVTNNAPGGSKPEQGLFDQMYNDLFDRANGAIQNELRASLPDYLKPVRKQAIQAYLDYEAAISAILQEGVRETGVKETEGE